MIILRKLQFIFKFFFFLNYRILGKHELHWYFVTNSIVLHIIIIYMKETKLWIMIIKYYYFFIKLLHFSIEKWQRVFYRLLIVYPHFKTWPIMNRSVICGCFFTYLYHCYTYAVIFILQVFCAFLKEKKLKNEYIIMFM